MYMTEVKKVAINRLIRKGKNISKEIARLNNKRDWSVHERIAQDLFVPLNTRSIKLAIAPSLSIGYQRSIEKFICCKNEGKVYPFLQFHEVIY